MRERKRRRRAPELLGIDMQPAWRRTLIARWARFVRQNIVADVAADVPLESPADHRPPLSWVEKLLLIALLLSGPAAWAAATFFVMASLADRPAAGGAR